jgi:hypothetical protein
MPNFSFNLIDHDGFAAADGTYEFSDLAAAVAEAEVVLAEMALDGLPALPYECLEVEVLDERSMCVAKLTLELRRQFFS